MRFVALTAALALGILAAAPDARAKKKPASPFQAQIIALQETNAVLAKADHDYKGHRVKAMKEIHRAIHALKYGTKNPKNPFKTVKGAGDLPQDQSDALLKKAQAQLTTIQGQLTNVQDPRAAIAVAAIQTALQELTTALKIN
jgi:hypothetical protein